jgi:hypothetical protein
MQFDIITIFPKIFNSFLRESLISRARKKKLIKIKIHDLREWTSDRHKTVDDKPFGGGLGMVMKVEPIYQAVAALKSQIPNPKSQIKSQIPNSKSQIKSQIPNPKSQIKSQIPNSKSQIKSQIPNSKFLLRMYLESFAYVQDRFGIWNLEFGICILVSCNLIPVVH